MVSQIRGTVTGQTLVLEQDLIVTGTKSYLEAEFSFSPEWAGMSIWAKFTLDNQCWNINLHDGRIGQEDCLNLTTGVWELSLLGLDPDGLPQVTTEPRDLSVRRTNLDPLEPLPEVPPTAAEQIDKKAQRAMDIAAEVQRRADEGEFDFRIEKVYPSVEAMEADFGNPDLKEGANVLIETGDPDNPDNSKWYVKGAEKWEYIGDLSGEMGIRGPQGFTFTAHTRRVENGVEISWTNNGGLENPEPQIVYDYVHSEEFSALAEQVRSDARASAASKNAAGQFAENASGFADTASGYAADALKSSKDSEGSAKAAAKSVTDAAEQVRLAKKEVQNAAGQVDLAKQEVVNAQSEVKNAQAEVKKATEQVTLASKEVEKAKTEVVNAQNEVKNAQAEVAKATQQADRAKSEADRATEAAENAGRGYTNQVAANALVRTVQGEVIAVDDVSPLEHEVGCRVGNVNQIATPYEGELNPSSNATAEEIENGGIHIKVTGKITGTYEYDLQGSKNYAYFTPGSYNFGYYGDHLSNGIELFLQAYKKSGGYSRTVADLDSETGDNVPVELRDDEAYIIRIYVDPKTDISDVTIYPQLTAGSAFLPQTPYIPDLSKVTVKRLSSNVLPFPYYSEDIVADWGHIKSMPDGSVELKINKTIPENVEFDFTLVDRPFLDLPAGNWCASIKCDVKESVVVQAYDKNTGKFIRVIGSIGGTGFLNFNIQPNEGIIMRAYIDKSVPLGHYKLFPSITYMPGEKSYEKYVLAKPFVPSSSGIVSDMTSLSPNMTILTDTPGALLDVSYNQDSVAVIKKLSDRIAVLEAKETQI